MKLMNLFRPFAAIVLAAATLVACNDDKPNPGPEEPGTDPLEEAIEFDGVQMPVRSVFSEDVEDGLLGLFMAADEGITSSDQLTGGSEYAMMAFGDVGEDGDYTIDLKNAETPFRIFYVKGGEKLVELSEKNLSAFSEGGVTVTEKDEKTAVVDFSVTLSSGELFRGNVTWTEADEPTPPGPDGGLDDLKPETFVVNGTEIPVGKAFLEEYAGYMMLTVTPDADAESFDWIYENDAEYFQVIVLPSLCNREFDVMTETEAFTISSTLDGAQLATGIAPGVYDDVESGTCRLDFENPEGEVFARLTLADGSTLAVRASATMTGTTPAAENYITRNGEKKPLRAAFYYLEDGMAMLYFTPGDIDYFEEIENTTYYVILMTDDANMTGNPIDIASTDKTYQVFLIDNLTGDVDFIQTGIPEGATGTFSIAQSGSDAEHFTAEAEITFGSGNSIAVEFDGKCKSIEEVPEEPNEFIYNGETYPINSVVVDTRSEPCSIWLSAEEGIETVEDIQDAAPVHITAPSEAFTGEGVGFSTYKETLAFEHDGRIWNYGNGDSGTLIVSLDGEDLQLDFNTYGELKGHYQGTATVLK